MDETEQGMQKQNDAQPGRRGRPGASRRVYSPRASFATIPGEEKVLALHVARIVGELNDTDSLSRHELADRVGARRWGPGQLAHALRVARHSGYISHAGRGRYRAATRPRPQARGA